MLNLPVELGSRSYTIHIGVDLLANHNLVSDYVAGKKCVVVSNEKITSLYWQAFKQTFSTEPHLILLPDGESHKNLTSLNHIFTELLKHFYDRNTILIALGGGIIGDITGFAAACYQRGVDFIQIPTTLLAQVDSSVGGKTAVNHPLGKNMIGAFYQPKAVIADIATLRTLPANELSAGLAEIIKTALLGDESFFEWLEHHMSDLRKLDTEALTYAIKRSCEIKADIVARDETEQSIRALLNLGHTFGHAIETFTEYKDFLHGECVAIGTVMAAEFSQRLGTLEQGDVDRIIALIKAANLPIKIPQGMTAEIFLELMLRDKKTINSAIRLVLLNKLGEAYITSDYHSEQLKEYLHSLSAS